MKIYTRPTKPEPDGIYYDFPTITSIRKNSDRRYSLIAIFTTQTEAKKLRDHLNKDSYASIVPKKYMYKTLYGVYVKLAV
jgi:hypothetical protein